MTITIQASDAVPVADQTEDPVLQTQNPKVGIALIGIAVNAKFEIAAII
jgi:hypothetical protein